MNESTRFDSLNKDQAIEFAKIFACSEYSNELEQVLRVALTDKRNLPALRFNQKEQIKLEEYIEKWVQAFLKGFNNRPSVKRGNKSATYPDPIVKLALETRLGSKLEAGQADLIEAGHSFMMTIENLIGDLLEEYLSLKLNENNWFCCWGSTIDAVDFIKPDGSLIQIKNSDNSENSSSSRVRNGTAIQKWKRRKSSKPDTFYWNELNQILDRSDLSEESFREFVKNTIESNPDCLFFEGLN
jgi:hypothetical protein